jgi:hypothetical protein
VTTYAEIENAWWAWGRANYKGRGKGDRPMVKWMYVNQASFIFDGETWTRNAFVAHSNSGKTKYWTVIYTSASGRTLTGGTGVGRPVNRRNDPERN